MNEASSTFWSRTAWRWAALLLISTAVAGGMVEAWLARRGPAVPGQRWARISPRHAGFSREKLVELAWKAGGAGCIVKGGRMVFEWGDTAAVNDAASSTKPFYTFLAFKAIEEGRLESLDDRAVAWLPELGELNADLGHKDRAITFHHLLSQTSGYGLEEKPGEAFAYNDFNTGLLGYLLYHRVFEMPPGEDNALLNGAMLGEAIGFEHGTLVTHQRSRPARIRISVRDQARFMLLMLRGGRWGERQLLREDLFAQMMAFALPPDLPRTSGAESEHLEEIESFGGGLNLKNHLGCLGYYWWFNHKTPDGERLLPDAPPGAFMGSGYGGRFVMMAIPEEDLVVVWQDIYDGEDWAPFSENGRIKVNEVIRELLQARTEAGR
jgi:CubicO group peptidase (beta-lactamase class C family)